MTKNELMNKIIYKTEICFEDIYQSLSIDYKKAIDDLNNTELQKFIYSQSYSMKKGIEAGLQFDADTVTRTAGETALDDYISESFYEFPERCPECNCCIDKPNWKDFSSKTIHVCEQCKHEIFTEI